MESILLAIDAVALSALAALLAVLAWPALEHRYGASTMLARTILVKWQGGASLLDAIETIGDAHLSAGGESQDIV